MRTTTTRLVLLIGAAALLAACATRRYDVSAIGAVPKEAGSSDGYAARLRLSGLGVAIEALDERPAGGAAERGGAPPLTLLLRLESKEFGYSFDPSQVVFRDGLQEWRPRLTASAACAASGVVAGAGGGRVWLAPRACLALAFDASVGEGEGQELVLDGFARGRRPIPPVVMRVARREAVARSLTPGAKKAGEIAIKVPLYILLAPLVAY